MITISGLNKTFNPDKVNEVKALHGIDLEITKGEFLVVVGSNGSGKSTLLNIISGSVIPTRGNIQIDGTDVTQVPEHRRSKWIARVFQNPLSGTAADLTILENFRLASLRTGRKGLKIGITETFKATVKEKISSLGMNLENKIQQPMGTLSGGQRQALTLLMAVMADVKILLLDEPTAALDPRSAELIIKTADKIIADYKLTAVLITHNMKEAFNYGSRIIQMREGKIERDLTAETKCALTYADLYEWFM